MTTPANVGEAAGENHGADRRGGALRPLAMRTITVAVAGTPNSGKSTLINHLLGSELLATGEVRSSDQRGRHTTRHRQLVPLPGGGLVLARRS